MSTSKDKECNACVVIKRDTYDGIIREEHQVRLEKPIQQLRYECDLLNKRLREQGKKGLYVCEIKVNPKNNRSFQSAQIRFGRRAIIYINVAVNDFSGEKIKNITYFKHTYIKAVSSTPIPKENLTSWIKEHVAKWLSKGYKGYAKEKITAQGSLYKGYFENKDQNKSFILDSQYMDKKTIAIIIEQKGLTVTEISVKKRLKDLEIDINNEMIANGYTGQIKTRTALNGAPIISVTYKKHVETATCKYDYKMQFHNEAEKDPKAIFENTEEYRPTKKLGKSVVQVRSIAQDDNYTPEFRGKKINWERVDIEQLYREYIKLPEQQAQRLADIEKAMATRAVSGGYYKALKWLRTIKKKSPAWLRHPKAETYVKMCFDQISNDIVTPKEANELCTNYLSK